MKINKALDTLGELEYELEKLEGIADILNVSIVNLQTYNNTPIGIQDKQGSIYPVGEGLNELSFILEQRIIKAKETTKQIYKELDRSRENGK